MVQSGEGSGGPIYSRKHIHTNIFTQYTSQRPTPQGSALAVIKAHLALVLLKLTQWICLRRESQVIDLDAAVARCSKQDVLVLFTPGAVVNAVERVECSDLGATARPPWSHLEDMLTTVPDDAEILGCV